MITKFKDYIKENSNFDSSYYENNKFAKEIIFFFGERFNFPTNLTCGTFINDNEIALYNEFITEEDLHPMDSSGGYVCKLSKYDENIYYFQITEDAEYYVNNEDIDYNFDDCLDENIIIFKTIEELKKFTNEYLDRLIKQYYNYDVKDTELRLINVLDTNAYSKCVLKFFNENILNYNHEDDLDRQDYERNVEELKDCLKYLNKETLSEIEYFFNAKNFDLI